MIYKGPGTCLPEHGEWSGENDAVEEGRINRQGDTLTNINNKGTVSVAGGRVARIEQCSGGGTDPLAGGHPANNDNNDTVLQADRGRQSENTVFYTRFKNICDLFIAHLFFFLNLSLGSGSKWSLTRIWIRIKMYADPNIWSNILSLFYSSSLTAYTGTLVKGLGRLTRR